MVSRQRESFAQIWSTVAVVFGSLFVALALLVRGASRRLQSQSRDLVQSSEALRASYQALEQSSLETIETLNATVEAKDPYTAGHSHRVRAMSLLIGREHGLRQEAINEPERADRADRPGRIVEIKIKDTEWGYELKRDHQVLSRFWVHDNAPAVISGS